MGPTDLSMSNSVFGSAYQSGVMGEKIQERVYSAHDLKRSQHHDRPKKLRDVQLQVSLCLCHSLRCKDVFLYTVGVFFHVRW